MADEDLDLELNDGGTSTLRAEMAVSEFLLRYWVHLAVLTVVVILCILGYGQYQQSVVDGQRATTSAIADVEASLDDDMLTLAQTKAGVRPGQEIDVDAVKAAADKLMAVADGASGTSATEGYLKAAEYYRIADSADARREALTKAAASGEGVLHYAAEAALANLDVEAGNGDAAISKFRALQSLKSEFLVRRATLDLAGALETLGRFGEAVDVYDGYLSKFNTAPDVEDVIARRAKAAERAG